MILSAASSGQDHEARCGEGERETCFVSVCFPFPICETRLVRAYLALSQKRATLKMDVSPLYLRPHGLEVY
jgi:hypothetical protein